MKKIALITSTRAEFGLLNPLLNHLRKYESNDFKVELIVTGTHLYNEYGYTVDEIKASNERIDHTVLIPVKSSSILDISFNQASALKEFAKLFSEEQYDAIVILGDRYEMLAIAIAASNMLIPIIHLCGGDTTEGAVDEWIRHSITKMSYLHFPTNEDSYKRIIQLGESPDRVYNYGSTGIDNIVNLRKLNKIDALASIGLINCDYAVCTYHPVTMESVDVRIVIDAFLSAISNFPDIEFIITKSNADNGGSIINTIFEKAANTMPNVHVFASLGIMRYLSLVQNSEFVIGNSSSGITEAPALKVPTVNIGDRQRGRLQSESIINCKPDTDSIIAAIKTAMSIEHKTLCKRVISPYGDGHAAERIAEKIYNTLMFESIDLKKKFYTTP